jgi:cation diffusion facilitator CzcD-associated flavoprotein CzcO
VTTASQHPTIAILGAGIGGMCMAIQLKRAGVDSFTVYEKSGRVGGTWLDNSYPGAACDVPSHLYSFSFEPNPDWSHSFSEQPEIHRYLERCAEKYGLSAHLRFGVEMVAARYDDQEKRWRLETRAGELVSADIVVSGLGQLNRPHIPELPGLASFRGKTFHSARWDHEYDLTGKRVAVIGNGASAVQFVPRIAPAAGQLTVYQRSANWLFPRQDRAYSARRRWLFSHLPLAARLYRVLIYLLLEIRFLGFRKDSRLAPRLEAYAREHLAAQVPDPQLRAVLTPDYPIGCKRILTADDYYPALVRPNVALETSPIDRVLPEAIVTVDGVTHPTDAIIFGTGFETTAFLAPLDIIGRGGRRLADAWRDGAEAYLGVAVSDFPNFFLLYGPNTNLGHNSIIFMIECQVGYVLQCLQAMRRRGARAIDVRPEVMAAYNRGLQDDLRRTAWAAGCSSWYKNAAGKITNNWSGFTLRYWWLTRRPVWAAFRIEA